MLIGSATKINTTNFKTMPVNIQWLKQYSAIIWLHFAKLRFVLYMLLRVAVAIALIGSLLASKNTTGSPTTPNSLNATSLEPPRLQLLQTPPDSPYEPRLPIPNSQGLQRKSSDLVDVVSDMETISLSESAQLPDRRTLGRKRFVRSLFTPSDVFLAFVNTQPASTSSSISDEKPERDSCFCCFPCSRCGCCFGASEGPTGN